MVSRTFYTFMSQLALVPYAARAIVAAQSNPSVRSAEQLALTELGQLIKFHALSASISNIASAVSNVVRAVKPYVHPENLARFRSAVDTAVRSYWRSTGNSSKAVVSAPANYRASVRAVIPHVMPAAVRRAAIPSSSVALPFAHLIRDMRNNAKQHLVGVEPNPGPKGRSKALSLRNDSVAVAYNNRVVTTNPVVRMGPNGRSCRIQHRELLDASVPGSMTFQVQNTVQINPGLEATFPWLAPQAAQWEQYICHKLVAKYIAIAPTSTKGTVSVSPSYDASDADPETEQQLSNAVDTVEESVWKSFQVALRPSSMMALGPRRFVRPCAVAGDIKTFDVGVLYIATNNCADTSPVGKIWLEYDFEFFVPQNSPDAFTSMNTISYTYHTAQTIPNNVSTVIAFPAFLQRANPLRIAVTGGTFTPPKGNYMVRVNVSVLDSTSEYFAGSLSLWQNGVQSQNIGRFGQAATGGGTPNNRANLVCTFPMSLDGTETCDARVTLVGAAGVLSVTEAYIDFMLC